jgi:hypothetical protein
MINLIRSYAERAINASIVYDQNLADPAATPSTIKSIKHRKIAVKKAKIYCVQM